MSEVSKQNTIESQIDSYGCSVFIVAVEGTMSAKILGLRFCQGFRLSTRKAELSLWTMSQPGISADLMNTSVITDLETPVKRRHKFSQSLLMIIMSSLSNNDANTSTTSFAQSFKKTSWVKLQTTSVQCLSYEYKTPFTVQNTVSKILQQVYDLHFGRYGGEHQVAWSGSSFLNKVTFPCLPHTETDI